MRGDKIILAVKLRKKIPVNNKMGPVCDRREAAASCGPLCRLLGDGFLINPIHPVDHFKELSCCQVQSQPLLTQGLSWTKNDLQATTWYLFLVLKMNVEV
jgi:hypothetical protein